MKLTTILFACLIGWVSQAFPQDHLLTKNPIALLNKNLSIGYEKVIHDHQTIAINLNSPFGWAQSLTSTVEKALLSGDWESRQIAISHEIQELPILGENLYQEGTSGENALDLAHEGVSDKTGSEFPGIHAGFVDRAAQAVMAPGENADQHDLIGAYHTSPYANQPTKELRCAKS